MEKEKKLPNYNVVLEDWQEGVFATSLVGVPAIESDFVFYGKEDMPVMLFGDEEKREIVGAVMIPDKYILRQNPETGELFTVTFSKEVIEKLNERMKEYGYSNSFTFHHSYSTQGNVQILESWIKEFDTDKSNGYGFDLPIGTLFIKAKIKEDNLWEMIKENKLNGFSIELNASYILDEEDAMSKIEAFEHNLEQDEFTLAWDGSEEINAETLLFSVTKVKDGEKESEVLEKFSGEVTVGDVDFKFEAGIGNVVEKVVEEVVEVVEDQPTEEVFNKEDMIAAINDAITLQIEALKGNFEAQEAETKKVTESLEEIKLLQKQISVKAKEVEDIVDDFEITPDIRLKDKKIMNDWMSQRTSSKKTHK